MKSYGNLWPRVTSFENLFDAFRRARKGKRSRRDIPEYLRRVKARREGFVATDMRILTS